MDAAECEAAERVANRLGYPWDALWEARFATLEAKRAAELALGAGDAEDRRVAAFDLEGALLAEKARRRDLADVLLVMLAAATEERPSALYAEVKTFAGGHWMKGLEAWLTTTAAGGMAHVAELEERLRRAEAELKAARAERWELANWLARVERERQPNTTTGGPANGDRSEGEGQTVVAPDTGRDGRSQREAG